MRSDGGEQVIVASKFRRNKASLPASERARYSASLVEWATVRCKMDCHVIAALLRMNTYPDVERRVVKSPAQSASE